MKDLKQIALFAVVALVAGSTAFTACKEDHPAPPPIDTHDDRWDDSTGIAISDTLTVILGDEKWQTLTYSAALDTTDTLSIYRWVDIRAHADGATYPKIKLRMLLEEGNHTSHIAVNDLGMGYSIPGRLTGDGKCGYLFYYENDELVSPDGTATSDWWPWEITMSMLEYDRENRTITARVTGSMFHYESWLNHEVQYVDSAERRDIIISFGGLKVAMP